MNTNMNSKYYRMHADVLDVCKKYGIKLMPGKRAAYEIMTSADIKGLKDFLVAAGDMKQFLDNCVQELETRGYLTETGNIRNGAICRILRKDMLASSAGQLISNPDGKHYPQFIIRALVPDGENLSFTSNGRTVTFAAEALEDLVAVTYKDGEVYIKNNPKEHLHIICGEDDTGNIPPDGYGLFSENINADDFIREARCRGYLSAERTSRYKKYAVWKKENRSENEQKYNEYQKVLLGLKQP